MKRKIMLMSMATSMLLIATVLSGATARVASADRSTETYSTAKAVSAKSIDVQNIDIGTGSECFRFAIFADPQFGYGGDSTIDKLQIAVNEIIAINNDGIPADHIKFVMVLGDLIQGERSGLTTWGGESDYRNEYYQVKEQLIRLEAPLPTGAGIRYIPVIGNHDVWYKSDDYLKVDNPPDYPEELFEDYFGPQYATLNTDLAGWAKQVDMPSSNPYNTSFATPELQNFAFDAGPYHFICLDFCARGDFDAIQSISYTTLTLKKFWGYADLNDFNNGTWQWLDQHLSECKAKGIKDVIVFTHHPPIYELDSAAGTYLTITTPVPITFSNPADVKGEMHIVYDPNGTLTGKTLSNYRTGANFLKWDGQKISNGTQVDRVEGDMTFAFNKQNYDGRDEYGKLTSIFSTYGMNIIHWFSGHCHLKGFEWRDAGLSTDVTVVPSIMPASNMYGIQFTGGVTINEQASAVVTPLLNTNGCLTIVNVKAPPPSVDLSIYSQWGPNVPDPKMWDNPDIQLYDSSGVNRVSSHDLEPMTEYTVRARIYNRGCENANDATVKLWWGTLSSSGWILDSTGIASPNPVPVNVPAGEEEIVSFSWTTPIVTNGNPLHCCLMAKIDHLDDPLPAGWANDLYDDSTTNNVGQENCDIVAKGKISIPVTNPTASSLTLDLDIVRQVTAPQEPGVILPAMAQPTWEAKWANGVKLTEGKAQMKVAAHKTVYANIVVSPPPNAPPGQTYRLVITSRVEGKLLGGVEVTVVNTTAPELRWAGTSGYTRDGIDPDRGIVGTNFVYKVKYVDADNNPPKKGGPLLYILKGGKPIQGSPFLMREWDVADKNYRDGKIYSYSVKLSSPGNDYTYFFWTRDSLGVQATGPAANMIFSAPWVITTRWGWLPSF